MDIARSRCCPFPVRLESTSSLMTINWSFENESFIPFPTGFEVKECFYKIGVCLYEFLLESRKAGEAWSWIFKISFSSMSSAISRVNYEFMSSKLLIELAKTLIFWPWTSTCFLSPFLMIFYLLISSKKYVLLLRRRASLKVSVMIPILLVCSLIFLSTKSCSWDVYNWANASSFTIL